MLYTLLKKRSLKRLVIIFLIGYVMVGGLLYFFQERLIFLPEQLSQNYQYELKVPYEEIFLNPSDEVSLNVLHLKAKSPKGLIIYNHGNAGSLKRWGSITSYFVGLDFDVIVYDYRTYGKSTGLLSEKALYEDAQYIYDYSKRFYKESEIIIYGRSLGTGIASYLASKNKPKQLVLETPFYSLIDVAQTRFPIFPVKQLMTYELPSYRFLQELNCPVLMLHGTEDQVVSIESALKLKNAILEKKPQFVTIPGGAHNNLSSFEKYHKSIANFLK